ncbi:MAG: hypothetical protein ACP5UA_01500 [Candidatus Hydrogenedens sp.]
MTVFTICTLLLFSCGKKNSTTLPTAETTPPQKQSIDDMNVSSVDLYHHDPRPTIGEARKPTLWLHAEKFAVIDENTWKVEDVHAVIYDIQSGKEHIKISAREGVFEKMNKASLVGNVEAQMDNILFNTDGIEWSNRTETEPARIWTHGKIAVQGTDLHLDAENLIIYPDTKEFELEEVSGQVPLILRNTT